jgi:hypothetical protein
VDANDKSSSHTCPSFGESWTVVEVKGMARLELPYGVDDKEDSRSLSLSWWYKRNKRSE